MPNNHMPTTEPNYPLIALPRPPHFRMRSPSYVPTGGEEWRSITYRAVECSTVARRQEGRLRLVSAGGIVAVHVVQQLVVPVQIVLACELNSARRRLHGEPLSLRVLRSRAVSGDVNASQGRLCV